MTSIKEAIKKWEAQNKRQIADELEVGFQFQNPPIEKLDANIAKLVNCEKLYLSSNVIEKVSNLGTLKNLKVLSVSRCKLLTLSGIEATQKTLEELWASYNMIIKLGPLVPCKQLKVLYLNYNHVREWAEIAKLSDHQMLKDVGFIENPIGKNLDIDQWRNKMLKVLPRINRLDGEFLEVDDDVEVVKKEAPAKVKDAPAAPAATDAPPQSAGAPPPPPPTPTAASAPK